MVSNKPVFISVAKLNHLRHQGIRYVDTSAEQIDELCEIRFARWRDKPDKLATKKIDFQKRMQKHTVVCFFPWRHCAVRLLPKVLFEELRTARNRNLITKREQSKFQKATVAIAGLSVGSNIARLLTLQGGPSTLRLADADSLSLSNLNRILATSLDLGRKKTEVLAEHLYEMNPFLGITLYSQGLTVANCADFLYSGTKKVSVLVEEIDSLPMKIELRKLAAKMKIPVVSIADNGDGVIVEIERYDQGFKLGKFLSKLKILPKKLTTIQDKAVAITKFIGIKDIETRMLESITAVGSTLYSWPQLGGAAALSGVVGAYCVRQIVNGYKLPSGRYVISLPTIFKTKHLLNAKARQKVLRFFQ